MRVILYECSQRSLRWALLLPANASAPDWQGVEVTALRVYPCEAHGVAALSSLAAVLAAGNLPTHGPER